MRLRPAANAAVPATLDKAIDGLVRQYLVNRSCTRLIPKVVHQHHDPPCACRFFGRKAAVVSALASGPTARCCSAHEARRQKLAKQLCAVGIPRSSCTAISPRAPASATSPTSPAARYAFRGHRHRRPWHPRRRHRPVIHVDPPASTRRSSPLGRTARAGAEGVVATVMTPDQAGDVRRSHAQRYHPDGHQRRPAHPLPPELSGRRRPRSTAPAATEDLQSAGRQRLRSQSTPRQPPARATQHPAAADAQVPGEAVTIRRSERSARSSRDAARPPPAAETPHRVFRPLGFKVVATSRSNRSLESATRGSCVAFVEQRGDVVELVWVCTDRSCLWENWRTSPFRSRCCHVDRVSRITEVDRDLRLDGEAGGSASSRLGPR